ncbi:MAG: hypothetical protein H0Z24_07960 [Thermosipho sp. (in: Bacteria)]|nr:hypothetical protein [Thermosipho sp. (in: thermotogales)]
MKKLISILLVSLISLFSFSNILEPFEFIENYGLINHKGFNVFALGINGEFDFNQYLFTFEYLSKLLNEGIVDFNEISQLVLGENLNGSAYAFLKIGQFSFGPYLNTNSVGNIALPDEVVEFLKNDVEINKTYYASSTSFISLEGFIQAGISLGYKDFYVSPNVFIPAVYVFPEGQSFEFKYTSSSTPPVMTLDANLNFKMFTPFLSENINISENLIGIALSVGYASDSFGVAVNGITIKPSEVEYVYDVKASYSATYNGLDNTFENDATVNYLDVAETRQISLVPEVTGYYKTNLFVDLSAFFSYRFDGKWMVGGSLSKKILFFTPSYSLLYKAYNGVYMHIIGLESDFKVLKFNSSLIINSNQFLPIGEAKPGLGFRFAFNLGF